MEGVEAIVAVEGDGLEVAANGGEGRCPFLTAERPADLVVQLHHAKRSLGDVVVEADSSVVEEAQHLVVALA